jgi:hypothetical protein
MGVQSATPTTRSLTDATLKTASQGALNKRYQLHENMQNRADCEQVSIVVVLSHMHALSAAVC